MQKEEKAKLIKIETKPLESERLFLRKARMSDAEKMFNSWFTDEKTTEFLTWYPHTNIEQTKSLITRWQLGYKQKNQFVWVIVIKQTGDLIGTIGGHDIDQTNKSCEVGYCLGSKYWNNGYLTEALRPVIEHLFQSGINRIAAMHDVENAASGRVMEKCNMKYEGTLRQFAYIKNKFRNMKLYAIIKDDVR